MEVILVLGQFGWLTRRFQPLREGRLQVEDRCDLPEVLAGRAVDVDPQKAAFTELGGQILREIALEVDVAVGAICVVQPRARTRPIRARTRLRRCGQRSDPSRSAPAIASAAIPYCRTSIARSAPRPVVRISARRTAEVGR